MQNQGQSVKAYFSFLTIVHAVMLLGMLLFAGVVFYLVRSAEYAPDGVGETGRAILLAVPVIILVALLAGFIYFRRRTEQIRLMSDLSQKLKTYKTVQIIRYAIFEAPVLFVIVVYLLTGHTLYLYLILVLLFVFVLFRPGRTRAIHDLELTAEEQQLLDDPDFRVPQGNLKWER